MINILPILMLSISILSFLWYLQSANDIYRVLAVGLGVVGTIWGFAIAHWALLAICLVALLFGLDQRILRAALGD